MVVKPPAATQCRKTAVVDEFNEYYALSQQKKTGAAAARESERFAALDSLSKRGQLHSFISYIQPLPFYIAYSAIVAIYIILGGLRAAAITEGIQGILILFMSFILIPIGLHRIGGFHGLHQSVPEYKFHLFGTLQMSDYTWYSIFAIFFGQSDQIVGLSPNMATGGSAKDEDTARFGMISGGFTKRLRSDRLDALRADRHRDLFRRPVRPGQCLGTAVQNAAGAGLLGLMLSGILLGHMPAVGVSAVATSGLFTRNIYEPMMQGRSEKHYLRVGQFAVAVFSPPPSCWRWARRASSPCRRC